MFDRFKQAITALLPTSTQHRAEAALAAKQEGDVLLKTGDLEGAKKLYRSALQSNPRMARAHFALGYALSEQDRALEAIAALKDCLTIEPDNLDALYVLGKLYLGQGVPTEAISLLAAVVERDPRQVFAAADLCLAHVERGEFEQAEGALQTALAANPENARLHFLYGNVKLSRHLPEEAVLSFQRAVSIDPTLGEAHHNAGLALQALARNEEALQSQDLALQHRPDYPAALLARARILKALRRRDEAKAGFELALTNHQRARATLPESADAEFDLAAVLFELERPLDSIASLDRVLQLEPHHADAHRDRAMVLDSLDRRDEAMVNLERFLELRAEPHQGLLQATELLERHGRVDRSIELYEEALRADDSHPGVIGNYASVLQMAGRYDEALAACERALSVPVMALKTYEQVRSMVLSNRGTVLMDLGRRREALSSFEEALKPAPDTPHIRYNESLGRLSLGELERGWESYEFRWKSALWLKTQKFYGERTFEKDRWLGQVPLAGRTILLHPEQGFGDTLQFCRYAALLAGMGAKVILEVPGQLRRLLRDLAGVDVLLSVGEPLPPHDLQCPLLSLPLACRTTEGTVPFPNGYLGSAVEYGAEVERWSARLGTRTLPRVGVVWSGNAGHSNDANRSIRLAEFSRIFSDRQRFVCLHNEIRTADHEALLAFPQVEVVSKDLKDFADTAALVANLDLVICVDTSVAHLAGALGKPVWVLVPANPDWRWMLERRDSPWYSSMRLFRQPVLGDWEQVLEEVRVELDRFFEPRENNPT